MTFLVSSPFLIRRKQSEKRLNEIDISMRYSKIKEKGETENCSEKKEDKVTLSERDRTKKYFLLSFYS